jgi:hypothetical protein
MQQVTLLDVGTGTDGERIGNSLVLSMTPLAALRGNPIIVRQRSMPCARMLSR